jgi:ketosteroid isomerase-like protein
MKPAPLLLALLLIPISLSHGQEVPDPARLAELDALWTEVSRSVREGDFAAFSATCHPEAVLVSGIRSTCYPLAQALARWEQEFIDTREGSRRSDVHFRFSRRLGDATTAFETGIFLYEFQVGDEAPKQEYIHLEALLTKTTDGWQIILENQKAIATKTEWDALAP